MRKNILFILKLSTKNETGFYLMNSYVLNSKKLKSNYNTKYITLYSVSSVNKLIYHLLTLVNLIKNSILITYEMLVFKPELIYFTISPVNSFLRDIVYVFIAKAFGVKLVYHLHGKGIKDKSNLSKQYLALYKWAYKNVDVICLSEKLSFDFDFLPINKYHIIPNAIKNERIEKAKTKKNSSINLLFLSNLIYSKGIIDYIESVKILLNKQFNIKARIVGKEHDLKKDEIELLIKPFCNNLVYLGAKYGDEKNRILSETDIFIFPSYKDVWGLVILEAMQAQLPVITTDEGAITDMIEDGVNGFIVEKRNPLHIAEKIMVLIENEKIRNEMGKRNKEKFLKNYTIDIFENRLNLVLAEILKDQSGLINL